MQEIIIAARGKRWSLTGYLWKVGRIVFPKGLDVVGEREGRVQFLFFPKTTGRNELPLMRWKIF